MGHTDQKEFFNDRNIIIDLFILALGIKTLFFLGFHIYKECAYKNVMEGKESNNHMSLNQCGRESGKEADFSLILMIISDKTAIAKSVREWHSC